MIQTSRSDSCARGLLLTSVATSLVMGACERKPPPPASASAEWREFEGSWNAAGNRRTLPLGADRRCSIINLSGTMLLSGDERPDAGFLAEAIALVDSETGLVGRGVWTDEHGDQLFSELKGEGTRERNHIVGILLGGTGRYGDASGTFEFSWQFVIELEDGSIQGRAVDLKGRFRLGQPTAGDATQ